MLNRYQKFLDIISKKLETYFLKQEPYICCKKGCSACCEVGEYPFSRLEIEYLMKAWVNLAPDLRQKVKNNIDEVKRQKEKFTGERFNYKCPFLIDKKCCVYSHRGLTCRIHGLAYLKQGNQVQVPFCASHGLNYSNVFNPKTLALSLEKPIKENLNIDALFRSDLAENLDLECGEIRPLINWF